MALHGFNTAVSILHQFQVFCPLEVKRIFDAAGLGRGSMEFRDDPAILNRCAPSFVQLKLSLIARDGATRAEWVH